MKWLAYIGLAMVVLIVVVFIWFAIAVNRSIHITEPITVTIEDRIGTEGTARTLQEAGVIRSTTAFVLHVLTTGQRTQLKSGTYTFNGNLTIPLVVEILTKQQSLQGEVIVTLPEGFTADDMGKSLATVLSFSKANYLEVVEQPSKFDNAILKEFPNLSTLEGLLFPDTYRVFVDATAEDVISKQLNAFDAKFSAELRDALTANGRSWYDAITLASIIEKEARTPEDMRIVADIFWKRIDLGMRLESDATINYITKKGDTTPSLNDLNVESAYNTYRNAGLPPTPIDNPGYDALYATAFPEANEYLFFLTTPSGEMKYSKTYEEHLTYKAQYYP